MPAQVDRPLEPPAPRSRALLSTAVGVALLAGPFLPGSFLSAGLTAAPGDVVTAAAEEAVAAAGDVPAPYGEPTTQCSVVDPRLPEISGMVVAGDATLVMNDGGDAVTVYVLDASCGVAGERTAPVDPYDPEDLALAADGTVWLADAGDNRLSRDTVAVIALRTDGSAQVYRLSYPDGPHDAEALLLAPDGTPYLVTKDVLGTSGVYRPAAVLDDAGTVPMIRVAQLSLQLTGTPGGPVGRAGQLMITGGAVSPDGAAIALRTYTDAYVWSLSGSDVPSALAADPVRVALPDSPQGEAISFAADGRSLLVSGEGLPATVTLVPAVGALTPAAATGPVDPAVDPSGGGLTPWSAGVIAAVAAAVVVWTAGRVRRRR